MEKNKQLRGREETLSFLREMEEALLKEREERKAQQIEKAREIKEKLWPPSQRRERSEQVTCAVMAEGRGGL